MASPTRPRLREELLVMERKDQTVRQFHGEPTAAEIERMGRADEKHLRRIRHIASGIGFPTAEQVGADGVHAFWLLVQHASADLKFQQSMLQAIEPRFIAGEFDPGDYALLMDRVLIAQGKPQRYGSQAGYENGNLVIKPLEDPGHVDTRRKEMGLMPLADYLCVLKAM